MEITLDQARALDAVARLGSYSKAAEHLKKVFMKFVARYLEIDAENLKRESLSLEVIP